MCGLNYSRVVSLGIQVFKEGLCQFSSDCWFQAGFRSPVFKKVVSQPIPQNNPNQFFLFHKQYQLRHQYCDLS